MTEAQAESLIASKITPEMIDVLIEATRVIGWIVDITEVASFIERLDRIGNCDRAPELDEWPEPYEIED